MGQHEGDMLARLAHDRATRENRPPKLLIDSDSVEGTTVFNCSGERIGSVARLLIDKRTGVTHYVEMEFGGFLGFGKEVYPLPWEVLEYDVNIGGYLVNLTPEQLKSAPSYDPTDRKPIDHGYDSHIRSHYGLPE